MNNQLERNNSYLGFTDNKPALQKAKIENCLDKVFRYSDGIMARKDAMINGLRKGKKPEVVDGKRCDGTTKKSYRMSWGNLYNEITKTEYDFCLYLIEHDLISDESVNTFIESENIAREKAIDEKRKAEEAARKEEKRIEFEKEEFKNWLKATSEIYENTTRGNIVEHIYLDVYGEFIFPLRAFELLACIDNIEKPLCREELQARLHRDNKASRKVFTCITGLKLPNTNKETMEFLNGLQKNDYKEMIEYKTRKKPVQKHEDKQEKFYVLVESENKMQYMPTLGSKVVNRGIDLFIHKDANGKVCISSVECGLKLATGKTKTEVIKNMKETFTKIGKETIQNKINEVVGRYGISPYLKQA